MSKILVTYGTAAHSTREVAEAVAQELERGNGRQVDLLPARKVSSLAGYEAVVVGSGVRAGRVYRETTTFLERYATELPKLPTAFFVVCLTMQEDTPENRREAGAYLEQMGAAVPMAQPAATELFGGLLDLSRLPWPLRIVMKLRKETPGDYRDWEAIHAWAASLPAALSA